MKNIRKIGDFYWLLLIFIGFHWFSMVFAPKSPIFYFSTKFSASAAKFSRPQWPVGSRRRHSALLALPSITWSSSGRNVGGLHAPTRPWFKCGWNRSKKCFFMYFLMKNPSKDNRQIMRNHCNLSSLVLRTTFLTSNGGIPLDQLGIAWCRFPRLHIRSESITEPNVGR